MSMTSSDESRLKVNKLLSIGYFDRITLDSRFIPMYKSDGIPITSGRSFYDNLLSDPEYYTHGIGKLTITLLGENFKNEDSTVMEYQHKQRELLELNSIDYSNGRERHLIAKLDILILKGKIYFPISLSFNEYCDKAFEILGDSFDTIQELKAAKALSEYTSKVKKLNDSKELSIGVISRVYVNKHFRRCGVSRWIHENIQDLVQLYSSIYLSGVVLTCGDFSGESLSAFNMGVAEYKQFLKEHYTKCGYLNIDETVIANHDIDGTDIMYKVF